MRPLDLSRWRPVPKILIALGALGVVAGFAVPSLRQQFAYSYLQAYMFFLSLGLGGLFLVLVHHLFDAGWSVPIRRLNEHLACLLPIMGFLFIPIAVFAKTIYPWMSIDPHTDHALHAKLPLFTVPVFYISALFCFLVWWWLTFSLRAASLQQDRDGAVRHTFRLRKLACIGIILFALTLTIAAIMWMKALQHQWFSTMYGVYYFAGSVWMTLATVYVTTLILERQGPLRAVIRPLHYYFIGSLLFAFTVFYAYIHFAQYFIIWNGNMPEETFWYLIRERGTWWDIGMIIIFGHFFFPFLMLLRIDIKVRRGPLFWAMLPMCGWAWAMHWIDLAFNIKPIQHPEGFQMHFLDVTSFIFIGGVLAVVFLKYFAAHPPYPLRDPRLAEGLGVYVAPASAISTAPGKVK